MKALTAFPQVLAEMDRNLQWTTDLGNAYYNQPQDVLEAVQVMRRRAQAAGTLRTTPQEVVRYDNGDIQLMPADPQYVYVPTYNPWAVYGEAVTPYPGFNLFGVIGNALGAILHYGPGIAMSAFAHTPWGWLAWGLDWLGHALLFHDSAYYSHSSTVADWGFPHRGFYAYSGRGAWGHESWRAGNRNHESWGHENWRNRPVDTAGWHSFGKENERAENMSRSANRGFEPFRGERDSAARLDSRASNRPIENRNELRSNLNEREIRNEERSRAAERTYASNFGRNDFGGRSSAFSSHSSFASSGKSHSAKSFNSHAEHFHASKAPKRVSSKSFGGGKSFGKSKSFGGGHSHGGGHSSGKHR